MFLFLLLLRLRSPHQKILLQNQFPSAVPASWVGAASIACQTALDNASGLLAALATRYDTAISNVSAIEARNSSTGTSPS